MRALIVTLLISLVALPAAAGSEDAVPTQVAVIKFGIAGVPTTTLTLDGAAWVAADSFTVPDELARLFYVRSDFWVGVGYRDVDICLESPSGECLTDALPAQIGIPCVNFGPECQSYAAASPIGENEPGEWTLRYSGTTNARHEIRVFAW